MNRVDRLIADAINRGVFPGAAYSVVTRSVQDISFAGQLTYRPDAGPIVESTLFDLASLTKIVATTAMFAKLESDAEFDLNLPAKQWLKDFHCDATIFDLLTHQSGLPAYRDYWRHHLGKEAILSAIMREPLVYEPSTDTEYSDLGFMLLGRILELNANLDLDKQFVRFARSIEMPTATYNPKGGVIAPTEERDKVLTHGVVHDENAKAMAGVSGHAGVFASILDMAAFSNHVLTSGNLMAWGLRQREHSSRGIGWDTNAADAWWVGNPANNDIFGHTGFTGTVIWCDPKIPQVTVLLTNRVHPTRENQLHREFFPQFFREICRTFT